jgi:putative resolvase
MKLSDYAKQQGVRYETAWRWFRDGKIKGHRVGKHTVMIDEGQEAPAAPTQQKVAIYARVSSAEPRDNLERQAERLVAYGTAKGYQITQVVKEIGSGVNDARPKFLALLEDPSIGILIIEHKDRATRFGFRYIESLFRVQGRMLEVVNQGENDKEDLLHDLASMIYSFCARLYGHRRAKRTTEMIVEQLQAEKGEEDATS